MIVVFQPRILIPLLLPCLLAGADDGIEEIVTGGMCLRCLQTRSGIKFVLTAERGTNDMDLVLKEIYVLVSPVEF